jgi:4-amino-4-deoxy-L-arabinose transferase-like glycosyltransferase
VKKLALIFLLAAATFLSLLGRRDIVTSHEARVAQTARIMAASGWPWNATPINVPTVDKVLIDGKTQLRPAPDGKTMPVNPWLVPVMNAQIRLQKPPLPYWCTATLFRLFGVGETQTRLPTALLGLLATFLIYDLAALILGHRAAWIAAGVWLSTNHFLVDEYRKSTADPYLAFFTLLCIWSYLKSSCSPRACSRFDGEQPRRQNKYIILFYLSLALAVLAKGPVPFITVGLALIPIHFFKRPKLARLPIHLFGLLLFILLAAPWYLYCIQHVPHAIDLWRYESVGEVSGENIEKARQWWSYIGYTFELAVPWTPIWISSIVLAFLHTRRRRTAHHETSRSDQPLLAASRINLLSPRNKRRLIAITWYALVILFFSFAGVKKRAYLLPAMPAQTLMIADALVTLIAFARRSRFSKMPTIAAMAQALIGIGLSISISVLIFKSDKNISFLIMCAATILVSLFALITIASRRPAQWMMIQFVSYAMISVIWIGVQRADFENRRSAKPFAAALQQYLPSASEHLIVHWLPEEVSFYLPLNLPHAGDSPYALMVVDHAAKDPPESPESLSQLMGDTRVIDARRIDLHAPDGNGRWRLFELTIDRSTPTADAQF